MCCSGGSHLQYLQEYLSVSLSGHILQTVRQHQVELPLYLDTYRNPSFLAESLLEVLRDEDLQSNAEAFLYCMGALKFISGSPGFLTEMVNKGVVEILVQLIKETTEDTEKHGACPPNSGHLLVQVGAVLEKVRG